MKNPKFDNNWPESWKSAFHYDQMELYGDLRHPGYSYSYRSRSETTFELLNSILGQNSNILDIAAGQGNFTLKLAEQGHLVTWNDLREELIGYIKLKHESGNITYAPGDIFKLNFEKYFDVILILEIIEHVAHPDRFLKRAVELLKPGGSIVMTTPNGAYALYSNPRFSDCKDPSIFESTQYKPNSDGHIFLLYPDEISRLANQAGLEISSFKLVSNPLTCGHAKLGCLLKFLPASFITFVEKLTRKLPFFISKRIHSTSAVIFRLPGNI